nr:molybdate ABC transporter substrate-binding protein [Pseudovibrio flavus]
MVFAAASMKDVLEEVATQFEAQTGEDVSIVIGGSAAIARQVARGAPADVVVLADPRWARYLLDKGVLAEQPAVLAGNELVFVRPAGGAALSSLDEESLLNVLSDNRMAIGDPATVPAGRYAEEALKSLGLWDALEDKLAPMENVRVTLAAVARGEVPLGIVYGSDVLIEPRVAIAAEIPSDSHSPIEIVGAPTTQASEAGLAFMRFLQGAETKAALKRFGFKAEGE